MKSNIVLTISDSNIYHMDSIVDKLEELGMSVHNTFEFGVIVGTMEHSDIKELKRVKEIESFTVDAQVNIPPPDEDIQ